MDRIEGVKKILNQPVDWVSGDKGDGVFTYLTEPFKRKLAKQINQLYEPHSDDYCGICKREFLNGDTRYPLGGKYGSPLCPDCLNSQPISKPQPDQCPECKGSGKNYGVGGFDSDFADCPKCKPQPDHAEYNRGFQDGQNVLKESGDRDLQPDQSYTLESDPEFIGEELLKEASQPDQSSYNLDHDEWYEWFIGMLHRKPDIAEKNAIRHLVEARIEALIEDFDTELQEYVLNILGYIEDLFPELYSSYWQNPRWTEFKQEQALKANPTSEVEG